MMQYDPDWTTSVSRFGDGEQFTIGERLCIERFSPHIQSAPHTHGHVEMNFVEHGRMQYEFDGRDIWIEPGELCLFWAGRPHRVTQIAAAGERQLLSNFCFMPMLDFLNLKNILRLQRSILLGSFSRIQFRNLSDRTFLKWRQDILSGDGERLECMQAELEAGLRRARIENAIYEHKPVPVRRGQTKLGDKKMAGVVGMLEYIVANFPEKRVVSNAARSVGLNGNYASNLFRASMGMTLRAFATEVRMSAAYRLIITTDLPVTSIQFDVGFRSASQFYENFRNKFGILPGPLRKRYQV